MAYKQFNPSGPDGAIDDGANTLAILTDNDNALRDGNAAFAGFFFWDYTPVIGGGTAEQPDEALMSEGTRRIKIELTWGVGGGADGNVTQAIYSYSSDSGSNYDPIGTQTITYDAQGNVTGATWA